MQGRERFGNRDLLRLDGRLPVHEGGSIKQTLSVIAVIFSTNAFQMLQSPLYGVASKLPAASTMVPVIVDHHDPACVHYQL